MTEARRSPPARGHRGAGETELGGGFEGDSTASLGYDEPSLDDALEQARQERDTGAGQAHNAVHSHWRVAAEEAIRRLADTGREFTVEDVTDRIGPPPGHHNAIGGAFIAASKRGEIQAVGYRQATRRSAHARVIRVWRGGGHG